MKKKDTKFNALARLERETISFSSFFACFAPSIVRVILTPLRGLKEIEKLQMFVSFKPGSGGRDDKRGK